MDRANGFAHGDTPVSEVDDISAMTGKMPRTVHLSYDMAVGPAASMPFVDVQLTPAPGDKLTILMFMDRIDGERHYFVLNEDLRTRLVAGLTGGVQLG